MTGPDEVQKNRTPAPPRTREWRQLEFPQIKLPPHRIIIRRSTEPAEFKVVALRDCPMPKGWGICDAPQQIADYWRMHVATEKRFSPDVESFVVILLDTRRHVLGHCVVGVGILDSVLVHPREVFRAAVVYRAHAIIVAHNHPSGDPTPSEADIRTTRDLIRAGQLLKIELLDHIVIGASTHASLKEMGSFYS